jgi:hypothetical protein
LREARLLIDSAVNLATDLGIEPVGHAAIFFRAGIKSDIAAQNAKRQVGHRIFATADNVEFYSVLLDACPSNFALRNAMPKAKLDDPALCWV